MKEKIRELIDMIESEMEYEDKELRPLHLGYKFGIMWSYLNDIYDQLEEKESN